MDNSIVSPYEHFLNGRLVSLLLTRRALQNNVPLIKENISF